MTIESDKQSNSTTVRIVDNIKKSDSDSWNYRALELSNEMLVVLISHPNIDKAAAALDVSIGSLADPRDIPGIAHFLEHMLFMGSSKVNHYLHYKVVFFIGIYFSIQVKMNIRN
jgi:secreted Zn-dependent insulinase-like peptidase